MSTKLKWKAALLLFSRGDYCLTKAVVGSGCTFVVGRSTNASRFGAAFGKCLSRLWLSIPAADGEYTGGCRARGGGGMLDKPPLSGLDGGNADGKLESARARVNVCLT